MWPSDDNALTIQTGEELERFDLGTFVLAGRKCSVLTGYELLEQRCWWCGDEIKRKGKHYCYGHMTQYYNHFRWEYASYEARKRSDGKCENCGKEVKYPRSELQVHHIVPLQGAGRFFSVYNLPWNLIVLCKTCHLEVHAAMRPPPKPVPTKSAIAISRGQLIFI